MWFDFPLVLYICLKKQYMGSLNFQICNLSENFMFRQHNEYIFIHRITVLDYHDPFVLSLMAVDVTVVLEYIVSIQARIGI